MNPSVDGRLGFSCGRSLPLEVTLIQESQLSISWNVCSPITEWSDQLPAACLCELSDRNSKANNCAFEYLTIKFIPFMYLRYNMMLSCWQTKPKDRPTFTTLREELDKLICVATGDDYLVPVSVSESMLGKDEDESENWNSVCPPRCTQETFKNE